MSLASFVMASSFPCCEIRQLLVHVYPGGSKAGAAERITVFYGRRGRPVKKPRFMTGQKTDEQLKFYMPAIATPDYISIRQDDLSKFFFQARYDHTTNTAQADLDAGKVAALPVHFKQQTKDGKYGPEASDEQVDAAFQSVVGWALEKHAFLTGKQPPPNLFGASASGSASKKKLP